jgi:hypothetical protein
VLDTEQPLEPPLIEQHFLVRRTPERTDLLGLAPGRKDPKLDPQHDELFEMRAGRIIAAQFPGAHGATGDPKLLGQARLRQTHLGAQRQHQLPEGIVSFTIKGSLHEQVSFLASPTSVNPCETMGNALPSAGRCISQATAIYS